jgi:ATP-dependent Clp protease adaptor protein ClpS
MAYRAHTKESAQQEVETLEDTSWQVLVYNDDINTFDWVITCLMKYCSHAYEQAGQCALIIHNNGMCAVKQGELDQLIPIKEALLECHLDARVEGQ